LLVLTAERIYLAPVGGEARPEMLASISSGGDLDAILGPLAIVIDLVTVSRMTIDLVENTLAIEYLSRGHETRRATVTFATAEAADACFTKMWRRAGAGLKLRGGQHDSWQLARAPLMMLFVTLIATGALALVLSVFEDFATARSANQAGVTATGPLNEPVEIPKTPLEALIGWMNWKVVCALGGIVAAASQVWLYRRLTTPPGFLELVRSDG
jgi:hypothetical protein